MRDYYIQNARAECKLPPVGTDEFPVIYLGRGKVIRNSIVISKEFPGIPLIQFRAKDWRFYSSDESSGEYLTEINDIQFESYWLS